ncbi:Melanin-concentrating hormone receptor [Salix suchowensis]|nr:Melanin-concentrating hormone receptor [Salix suchowensis]
MAALRWLVHSACHVLGYTYEDKNKAVGYPNGAMIKNSNLEMDPCTGFRMPLHYPRYTKADYEKMEEWKVDVLLREYGMNFDGNLEEKRAFAMGAFLWPDQY